MESLKNSLSLLLVIIRGLITLFTNQGIRDISHYSQGVLFWPSFTFWPQEGGAGKSTLLKSEVLKEIWVALV